MKLESLVLWEEKQLLTETEENEYGFVGLARFVFKGKGYNCEQNTMQFVSREERYAYDDLLIFLESEEASYLIRSLNDMKVYCSLRINDHVPYAFDRECFAFRVVDEDMVWYVSCTAWNERCHFSIYAYKRDKLFTLLAQRRGLPRFCYGIYIFTGERVVIHFAARDMEHYPQYGSNLIENDYFANTQNNTLKISKAQRAAMENGAVYGWETPMAMVENYDDTGHYCL